MSKTKATKKETRVTKTSKKGKAATSAVDVVKGCAEELLARLEVSAKVKVEQVEETYQVNVETEEPGLLIGYHGETLSSFQLILGLIVYRKLGEWARVVVEVGDYRAKREEQLRQMAETYAAQVVSTGQPLTLPYLPPIERRIIHLTLQDNPDVETVSEGEGNQRRVVVKPK